MSSLERNAKKQIDELYHQNKELKVALSKTTSELQYVYEKNRYLDHEISNYLSEINTQRKRVNNQSPEKPSYENSQEFKKVQEELYEYKLLCNDLTTDLNCCRKNVTIYEKILIEKVNEILERIENSSGKRKNLKQYDEEIADKNIGVDELRHDNLLLSLEVRRVRDQLSKENDYSVNIKGGKGYTDDVAQESEKSLETKKKQSKNEYDMLNKNTIKKNEVTNLYGHEETTKEEPIQGKLIELQDKNLNLYKNLQQLTDNKVQMKDKIKVLEIQRSDLSNTETINKEKINLLELTIKDLRSSKKDLLDVVTSQKSRQSVKDIRVKNDNYSFAEDSTDRDKKIHILEEKVKSLEEINTKINNELAVKTNKLNDTMKNNFGLKDEMNRLKSTENNKILSVRSVLSIQNNDLNKGLENEITSKSQVASSQEIRHGGSNNSVSKVGLDNFIKPIKSSCRDIFESVVLNESGNMPDKQQRLLIMLKTLVKEASQNDHINEYKFLLEQIDSLIRQYLNSNLITDEKLSEIQKNVIPEKPEQNVKNILNKNEELNISNDTYIQNQSAMDDEISKLLKNLEKRKKDIEALQVELMNQRNEAKRQIMDNAELEKDYAVKYEQVCVQQDEINMLKLENQDLKQTLDEYQGEMSKKREELAKKLEYLKTKE